MTSSAARRFYRDVTSAPRDGGYAVELDGRPVKTPATETLSLPSQALADAIADEWRAQVDDIRPETMPLTRLACAAIDHVAPVRDAIIDQTSAYGENDLLCYRAEGPQDLIEAQSSAWQPLLDWAAQEFDAPLVATTGIVHVSQPEPAIAALRQRVAGLTDFRLTALAEMTQITGSLVLAMAVLAGRLSWRQAFDASRLDEQWQNQQWGEDGDAAARTETLSLDMEAAAHFAVLSEG